MDEPTVLLLYDAVDAFQARRLAEALSGPERPRRVQLRIHSPGGEVLSGLALYHTLQKARAEGVALETVIDGLAASMASVVALAGSPVRMTENARLLLHNPWTRVEGDSATLIAQAQELERLQAQLVALYQAKCGLGAERIQALMDAERYLTAREALALGLIDGIVPAVLGLAEPEGAPRPLAFYQAYLPLPTPSLPEAAAVQAAQARLGEAEAELARVRTAFAHERAQWLAQQAVAQGKVPPQGAEALAALAQAHYTEAAALVAALPQPAALPTVAGLLTPTATDPRQGWNLRRWEKEDPEGLARLKAADPGRYQTLFAATYPAQP